MMKKQILVIALLGFISLMINPVKAQERPDKKPKHEQVETLSTDQIKTINEILADYNSESISEENAKAIMKAIHDAKIPGGKGVDDAINAAGFDMEEIKKLAPPPARPERGPRQE